MFANFLINIAVVFQQRNHCHVYNVRIDDVCFNILE